VPSPGVLGFEQRPGNGKRRGEPVESRPNEYEFCGSILAGLARLFSVPPGSRDLGAAPLGELARSELSASNFSALRTKYGGSGPIELSMRGFLETTLLLFTLSIQPDSGRRIGKILQQVDSKEVN